MLRSDGRWAASVEVGVGVDGRRKRKWFYAATQRDVIAKKRAFLEAQSQGISPSDERLTVGRFLDDWLASTVLPSTKAASTKADYADIVRLHLIPALGHIRLTRLSATDVDRYISAKRTAGRTVRTKAGYSPSTVRYHHAVLRTALTKATRLGLVTRNVAQQVTVEAPRRDPRVVHALDDDQLHSLLAAARRHRLYAFFLLLAGLGLRRGEALGLRWSDLDPANGLLTIEQQVQRVRGAGLQILPVPKTASSHRTVHVPAICLDALKAHRQQQRRERLAAGPRWQDNGLIFPSTVGTPMEPRNLNRILHRLCDEAQIPRERLHNLRHTAATVAYAQGLGDIEVQRMVGHQRASTTRDIYLHVVPALGREGAARLNEVLEGKSRHVRDAVIPLAAGDSPTDGGGIG